MLDESRRALKLCLLMRERGEVNYIAAKDTQYIFRASHVEFINNKNKLCPARWTQGVQPYLVCYDQQHITFRKILLYNVHY